MPFNRMRILPAIFLTVLVLKPAPVSAEKVAIPVFLNYPQVQLLMQRTMFTGPDNSVRYLLDTDGCNTVSFSEPHLSAEDERLRLSVKTLAIVGASITDGCMTLARWAGRAVVKAKPMVVNRQPLSIQFDVQAVEIFDQHGRLLSDSLLPPAFKAQLLQVLSRFHMDLKPATDQLKALLPYVVPRHSADSLTRMIDSLRIGHVKVRSAGLDVPLLIDVEELPQAETEPALTAIEVQQLEQRYQAWDAFLTFVVKEVADAIRSNSFDPARYPSGRALPDKLCSHFNS